MGFRYELEKGTAQHICPNCGKKEYKHYIDNNTNETISPEFGRCNRVHKCGYYMNPYKHGYSNKGYNHVPPPQVQQQFIPECQLIKTASKPSNFSRWLFKTFPNHADAIVQAILKYKIGSYGHYQNDVVFWRIDKHGRVVSGKVMGYDQNGKRVKKPPQINWVHKLLNIGDTEPMSAFFGEHLTNQFHDKPIAIVESEKTAIIASLFFPQYLWLASGGASGLTIKAITAIKDHNITLFPDTGKYDEWNAKAKKLSQLTTLPINISNILEQFSEGNLDLADFLINPETRDQIIKAMETPITETEIQQPEATPPADDVGVFWYTNDKDNLSINVGRYIRWLESCGVRGYMPPGQDELELVYIHCNVAEPYSIDQIRCMTNDHVCRYGNEVKDLIDIRAKAIFDLKLLKQVKHIQIETHRDTKTTTRFFFKNGWIEINADLADYDTFPELQPYTALNQTIWRSQIINDHYTPLTYDESRTCEFERFTRNVAGDSYERFITAHAYLIHNYKRRSSAFCIIATDANQKDGQANGRNGKGIFLNQSVNIFANTKVIDRYDPNKTFNFQEIDWDTRHVCFDDADPNFDLHSLFTKVTGSFTVEKKHRPAFTIPFEQAPKMSLCTNFPMKGEGDSYSRFKIIEFTKYYHKDLTPADEFGHDLIDEWTHVERNRYYNWVVYNMAYYLKHGIMD
jgi:hypothetical protein